MSIPLNGLMWVAAAAPIIVLMILMLKFQWGAAKAAPVGLAIALVSAFTLYKATPLLVLYAAGKGIWNAIVVLMVVWPAILVYTVGDHVGAFKVFRSGMQKFTPNELLQVLIIGWTFVSFLQGITGFGVPVAVGAPLLAGLGLHPLFAVVVPLVGHSWADTFGTLAAAWDSLALQANLAADPQQLLRTALWSAGFLWLWNAVGGTTICWLYGKGKAIKKGLPAILLISFLQAGGQMLLSQVNQTLCCFVPCCVALIGAVLLGKTPLYNKPWKVENSPIMNRDRVEADADEGPSDMNLIQAFFPYFVLTAVTLAVLLIPSVKEFLGRLSVGFAFPETSTGYGFVNPASVSYSPVSPFTHAFFFLLLSSLAGFLYFMIHKWAKPGDFGGVLKKSLKHTAPSAMAVVAFLLMSKVMSESGQTILLARGISQVLGKGYAVLAPVIGMLGAFMTSSNMSSNILFTEFQLTTANLLNFDVAPILGAQTAGGAIGATTSPGNIVLGTTTTGILGQEGKVFKKIMPITLTVAIILGIILFVVLVVLQ